MSTRAVLAYDDDFFAVDDPWVVMASRKTVESILFS